METHAEVLPKPAVKASNVDLFAITALAKELKLAVDQLEGDWSSRMSVRYETAARIHELREQAERLFETFD